MAEKDQSLHPHQEDDASRNEAKLASLSLQIQLAATAVATSFVLIFIPNVETISFTAFLVGYLFPLPFAMMTILTMTITWEVLASMVFAFSGITFPFKIISWTLIGLLGISARKLGAKYFYEFAIFGAIAAFLFDIIVTVSTALLFLNNLDSFYTVLVANLLIGFLFTLSHTVSNALLFSFIPVILRVILPLLVDSNPDLLKIPANTFDYLKSDQVGNNPLAIIKLDLPRVSGYTIIALVLASSLIFAGLSYTQPEPQAPQTSEDRIDIQLVIDYDQVLPINNQSLSINYTMNLLEITQQLVSVNYTTQFGQPFVQAINGVWQNQNLSNHYWIYYINGEYVNTGVTETFLEDGDLVEWTYTD